MRVIDSGLKQQTGSMGNFKQMITTYSLVASRMLCSPESGHLGQYLRLPPPWSARQPKYNYNINDCHRYVKHLKGEDSLKRESKISGESRWKWWGSESGEGGIICSKLMGMISCEREMTRPQEYVWNKKAMYTMIDSFDQWNENTQVVEDLQPREVFAGA
jgi:hypothetical protein